MKKANRSVTLFACPVLVFFAALSACTGDDAKPQEPVAPQADTSVYPEDPELASPDDPPGIANDGPAGAEGAQVPEEAGAAAAEEPMENDTGALTEDPFGAPKDMPRVPDDAQGAFETAPDDVDIPVDDVGMDGAAQQAAGDAVKQVGNAQPKAPPSKPNRSKGMIKGKSGKGKAAVTAPAGKSTRYVRPLMLNVRSAANAKAKIVRRLLGGARIFVDVQGDWAKIKDGQWVRTTQLSETPTRKVSSAEAMKAWKGKDTRKRKK